ncbi:MAG: hypothetical protein V1889_02850 [archaeon]
MKSLFVQVQLLADKQQQTELINFLKNYSGSVDFENIIALEVEDR